MIREYRGKVADEPNEWVYGYLVSENCIRQEKEIEGISNCCGVGTFSVIPESVGQFTGKYDMNHNKIFENDIVKIRNLFYIVEYDNEAALFYLYNSKNEDAIIYLAGLCDYEIEVIGNDFTER